MVKDHSDSERGNPLLPHGLPLPISSTVHLTTDRIIHTTAFVTVVVEHWLEREIAQWVNPMKDRSDDPPHHERTLLPRSHISLTCVCQGMYKCVCVCVCVCLCMCKYTFMCLCKQWWSRGYCHPGPNIYGHPYWCSRNTFAAQTCPPPPPFAPPLCVSVCVWVCVWRY